MSWRRFCKRSWRRFEDVLAKRLEDVLKTSWRRMTKTFMLVLIKTSWRRLLKRHELGKYFHLDQDVFWRRKTSSRRHQDECLLGTYNYNSVETVSWLFELSNITIFVKSTRQTYNHVLERDAGFFLIYFIVLLYCKRFSVSQTSIIDIKLHINPFMHNVWNGQTYFKNLVMWTPQDF